MSDIALVRVDKMFSQPEKVDKYCMAVAEGTGDPSDLAELLAALTPQTTSVTTTSYSVVATDGCVIVDDDAAGAVVTVTLLPAATAGDGYELVIFKKGNTSNVIIDGNDSETINGQPTESLIAQYESVKLKCDGTEYFIIEA